jgi:hypothetical protein
VCGTEPLLLRPTRFDALIFHGGCDGPETRDDEKQASFYANQLLLPVLLELKKGLVKIMKLGFL